MGGEGKPQRGINGSRAAALPGRNSHRGQGGHGRWERSTRPIFGPELSGSCHQPPAPPRHLHSLQSSRPSLAVVVVLAFDHIPHRPLYHIALVSFSLQPIMPFTQDHELDLLFPANQIPADVRKQLPQELHVRSQPPTPAPSSERLLMQIRPLASSDYARGHLDILAVLTVVSDPGEHAWRAQFEALRATSRTYYSIVIVDKASDRIVAVGTVFIERKFLRGLGAVGHIEDIAVDKSQQGKKLGLRIINALTGISENSGCYKTILNCSESNIRESLSLSMPARPLLCWRKETEKARRADLRSPFQLSMRSADTRRRRARW